MDELLHVDGHGIMANDMQEEVVSVCSGEREELQRRDREEEEEQMRDLTHNIRKYRTRAKWMDICMIDFLACTKLHAKLANFSFCKNLHAVVPLVRRAVRYLFSSNA